MRRSHGDPSRPFPFARAVAAFGIVLVAAGVINQLIQRSPIVVDVTLRDGSGGFILIGGMLALGGAIAVRARRPPLGRGSH